MALQFVLGSAGAGKTRSLYQEAIRRAEAAEQTQCLVIVPEQFTMQAQKELIRLHPRHGMMNIDVVSFKRLAYRVFEDLAVQVPTVLDDMGKSMVLRRVLAMEKKNLELYRSHLNQPGFINQLKSQISELYQYGIGPQELEELEAKAEKPLLRQKLQDLNVVCRAFQEYIADHFVTAEEILDILCRQLPRWEKLRDSVVCLVGFTGFTPVQYRILEILIERAADVVCSVTVDPECDPYRESGIQNLFYMSKHTVCRLEAMAAEKKAGRKRDAVLAPGELPRFAGSPALEFLEKNLYRYSRRTWQGAQDQITLYCGQTPGEEVDFVVRTMEELVRSSQIRYRDMAVITGDLASYGREVSRQLEQAQIPCFMDDKRSILDNPMVELIRALLEMVQDFSYENVFRYLKTGLVYDETFPEPFPMICRLENYVRALGIRGWKQWSREWDRVYRGAENLNLEELNRFRQWVLEPVDRLRQVMADRDSTVGAMTEALREYLERMDLQGKLAADELYFSERGRRGDERTAQEYSQIYGRVMELLDQLVGLLGDEKTDRRTYAQILDAGFGEIQVGTIPATLDQVMVGDITRSRLDGIKVLFFVGVNDGIVPQKKNGGSLLTDRDREFFKAHDLELAPTAREESCMQKFYLYLLLSKPSRRLYLSYAGRSGDGKALRPSVVLSEVNRLFPELKVLDRRMVKWPVQTPREGLRRLMEGLQNLREQNEENDSQREGWGEQEEEEFQLLYRWFFHRPEYADQVRRLTEAAFYSYEERGIGRAAARALYGRILQGSVTRLEKYASCAYAHFLRYGLELMERQEYQLEAVDLGNLLHQSIDCCFQTMKDRGGDWLSLTEEQRRELVHHSVSRTVESYGNSILSDSARYAWLAARVERMTDRTVWALAEQIKRGDFVPSGFEVSFSAADNLKAMRIGLSKDEELWLRGRIDRVDLCRQDDLLYVKIIDYKSGSTSFDLAALYHGLQLQLVVYLDAAMEAEKRKHTDCEVAPAAILYYNIQDPLVEKDGEMKPEQIEELIFKQLRMNGLVNRDPEVIRHMDREFESRSDVIPVAWKEEVIQESRSSVASSRQFEHLKDYVNRKIRQTGQEILKGSTDLAPCKQGSRTACDYCPYHAVCGFDTKTAGYGYRRLKALKPEEIWKEIAEEETPEAPVENQSGEEEVRWQ